MTNATLLNKLEELSTRVAALESDNLRLREENARLQQDNRLLRQKLDQYIVSGRLGTWLNWYGS